MFWDLQHVQHRYDLQDDRAIKFCKIIKVVNGNFLRLSEVFWVHNFDLTNSHLFQQNDWQDNNVADMLFSGNSNWSRLLISA